MAEILIQMHHGIGRRVRGERDWVSTKRGDVICVHHDGWWWGYEECQSWRFSVLCFPGMHESAFDRLLEPAYLLDHMLMKRRLFIDFDSQRGAWLANIMATASVMRLDPTEQERLFGLVRPRDVPLTQLVFAPSARIRAPAIARPLLEVS